MSDAACRASQNAMRLISFISSPTNNRNNNNNNNSAHHAQYSPNSMKRRNYENFKSSLQPASPVYEAPSDRLDRELARSLFDTKQRQNNNNSNNDENEIAHFLQRRQHSPSTTRRKNARSNSASPQRQQQQRHVSFVSNNNNNNENQNEEHYYNNQKNRNQSVSPTTHPKNSNDDAGSNQLISFAQEFLQIIRNQQTNTERQRNQEIRLAKSNINSNSVSSSTLLQQIETEYAQSLERLEEALTQKECELMMREAEIMLGEADEASNYGRNGAPASSPPSSRLLPTATLSLVTSQPNYHDKHHNGRISKFDVNIQKCRDEISSLRDLLLQAQKKQEKQKLDSLSSSAASSLSPNRKYDSSTFPKQEKMETDDKETMENLLLDFIRQKQMEEEKQEQENQKRIIQAQISSEQRHRLRQEQIQQEKRRTSTLPIISPAMFDEVEENNNNYLEENDEGNDDVEEEEEEDEQEWEVANQNSRYYYDRIQVQDPNSNGISRLSVHSPPRLAPPNKLRSRQYYAPTYRDIQRHYSSMRAFAMDDGGSNDEHENVINSNQQKRNIHRDNFSSHHSNDVPDSLKDRPIFSAVELMRHYEETGLQRKYGIALSQKEEHREWQRDDDSHQAQQQPFNNNNNNKSDNQSTSKYKNKYNNRQNESSLSNSNNKSIQLLDPTRSSQLDTQSKNYSPIRTITVPPQLELIHADQERKRRAKKNRKATSTRNKIGGGEEDEHHHDDDDDPLSQEDKQKLKSQFTQELRKRQHEIDKNFKSEIVAVPLQQGLETQWIAHTCDAFRKGSIIETTCLLSDLISGRSWYCSLFLLRRHAVPHLPELQLPSCVRCTLFVEDVIDAALMQDEYTVTVSIRARNNNNVHNNNNSSTNMVIMKSTNEDGSEILASSPARLAAGANYAGVPCSISKSLGEQHLKIECETKVEARTWLELFALSILEQQKQGEEASP